MLGQTVEAKSPLSKWAMVWLLLGIVLGVGGAVTSNPHFLMAALLPIVMGVALWKGRAADVVVTLEEKGIALFGTQHTLNYDEITAIFIGNTLLDAGTSTVARGPITIMHKHGRFFLPEQMNVSVVELGQFLVSRVPEQPEKEVHPSLAEYAAEQLAKFGPEKVTCIHQRPKTQQANKKSGWATFGKGLLVCGICWLVVSIVLVTNEKVTESFAAWAGLGALAMVVGFSCWLLGRSRSSAAQVDTRKHGAACLVIGPAGLGLAQGDLQGKLRWDEITSIKNDAAKSFGGKGNQALHLSFAGGVIVILDIYDRSLMEVASLISKNQPGKA